MTEKQAFPIQENKLLARFLGYTYYPHPTVKEPGWKSHPDASVFAKHNIGTPSIQIGDQVIKSRPSFPFGRKAYLCRAHKDLKFHRSWNALKRVIDKIGDIDNEADIELAARLKKAKLSIFRLNIFCSLHVVFDACVEFVNWYNKWCDEVSRNYPQKTQA